MREILFRGKSLYTGEWVEGYYVKGVVRHGIVKSFACSPRYDVIPETVGQFTGLTDKNGKKILEGDIVKGAWNTRLVIYYDDCYLQFRARHKWGENEISYYGDRDKLEIIGNIHDTPELLERGDTE